MATRINERGGDHAGRDRVELVRIAARGPPPQEVRLLLIGESAPDANTAEPRFFYAPKLDRRDNLFRAVVEAMFDSSAGHAGDPKAMWHARLKAAGVYLIDLVPDPVDKRRPGERAQARRGHVNACVRHAEELKPAGIIICHAPSFDVLAGPLRRAALPLLHEERIPFPLGNHRERFVNAFRAARQRLPSAADDVVDAADG